MSTYRMHRRISLPPTPLHHIPEPPKRRAATEKLIQKHIIVLHPLALQDSEYDTPIWELGFKLSLHRAVTHDDDLLCIYLVPGRAPRGTL